MVVLTDLERSDSASHLVAAAELLDDNAVRFMTRHSAGIIYAPLPDERADRLALAPMVSDPTADEPAGTVSMDFDVTASGASVSARAATIRALAHPESAPHEFRRPGHVFPLRARRGGVLAHAGHTEATVDLLGMAGLSGVGATAELVTETGDLLLGEEVGSFADEFDLPTITVTDIVRHRRITEFRIEPGATARMPTAFGTFRATGFRDVIDGAEHLALVAGNVALTDESADGFAVHVHRECPIGDTFGARGCLCSAQLRQSMRAVAAAGAGVIVYLRTGHQVGLLSRIAARHQDLEERDLDDSAQILRGLGIGRVRPLSDAPALYDRLADHGIEIVSVDLARAIPTPRQAWSDNLSGAIDVVAAG